MKIDYLSAPIYSDERDDNYNYNYKSYIYARIRRTQIFIACKYLNICFSFSVDYFVLLRLRVFALSPHALYISTINAASDIRLSAHYTKTDNVIYVRTRTCVFICAGFRLQRDNLIYTSALMI